MDGGRTKAGTLLLLDRILSLGLDRRFRDDRLRLLGLRLRSPLCAALELHLLLFPLGLFTLPLQE